MIKIDRTYYKRKLWSPKFFSKNQNWILKSRPKFSNFQKTVILRKWKYPIFVHKVYKIIKLRQLFLSRCPQNNFKIFHYYGFLRFFDIFLKFKKKRGGKSGQNHKKYKIETIFYVNFERFEIVFWKIFQRKNIFILLFFFHFLPFFLLNEHPKGTKIGMKQENPLFFKKRFMQKVLDLLQKFNKCCKKNFQQFFGTYYISKFFCWMIYQHQSIAF